MQDTLNLKHRYDERYIYEWGTHVNKNSNSFSHTSSNTKASANTNANAETIGGNM